MDYLTQFITQIIGPQHGPLAFSLAIGIAVMLGLLAIGILIATLTDPLRKRLQLLGSGVQDKELQSALQRADTSANAGKVSAQAMQLILLAALPLLVFMFAGVVGDFRPIVVLIAAVFAGGVGFLVPPVLADIKENRRKLELSVGFPEALDLLVACTEAGMGLNAAFLRVAEQMVYSHPAIAQQFNLLNYEIRGGVDRFQALRNFAERTNLNSVRSLVSILSQSIRYGTSIAETLRVFAEDLRDRRMQEAEEAAAKIGTKMIFPLVTCLFPAFFIIAVGPAVIGAIRTLSQ